MPPRDGNWFVALPFESAEVAAKLVTTPIAVRAFHPDDLHLTVAFLGAIDEPRARLAFEAADFSRIPFEVTLGEVVPMGPQHRFSALSALLVEGRAEVEAALLASRDRSMRAAGLPPETRPPKAHVTLGRPAEGASVVARRAALAWAQKLDVAGIGARLDRIALYAWSEDRSDRLFRKVIERPLAP